MRIAPKSEYLLFALQPAMKVAITGSEEMAMK